MTAALQSHTRNDRYQLAARVLTVAWAASLVLTAVAFRWLLPADISGGIVPILVGVGLACCQAAVGFVLGGWKVLSLARGTTAADRGDPLFWMIVFVFAVWLLPISAAAQQAH